METTKTFLKQNGLVARQLPLILRFDLEDVVFQSQQHDRERRILSGKCDRCFHYASSSCGAVGWHGGKRPSIRATRSPTAEISLRRPVVSL